MDFITQNFMTIVAALIGLVALIVALVLWRTFSPSVRGRRGQRLGISEYHELDKMRRLVLVRRDNVEHLILIGGSRDVVIESGIGIPGQASSYAPPALEDVPRPPRPAPRPAVFGERKPPPPLRSVDPAGPREP